VDPKFIARLDERKPLADLVFEALRDGIISGRLAPGEWLRQEHISEELGVSQTPVRQALERLAAEGLVERVAYRGVRVPQIEAEDFAEIFGLRLLLEPLIMRHAARNISPDSLAELNKMVEDAQAFVSLDQMSRRRTLNRELHLRLSDECGYPLLSRLFEMVFNRFPHWMIYEGMFRQIDFLEGRLKRETAEHRAMLAAISEGDVEMAERLAKEHIHATGEELAQLFDISDELLDQTRSDLWPRVGNGEECREIGVRESNS
jgi:DNA-binding GntR family transcriptional regulator